MKRPFFRLFSLFLGVIFFAWLLPLGAFIKPGQEKIACGGNRAMHMCPMMNETGARFDTSDKVAYSSAGAERTQKAAASDNGQFLPVESLFPDHKDTGAFFDARPVFLSRLPIRPVEHVPLRPIL